MADKTLQYVRLGIQTGFSLIVCGLCAYKIVTEPVEDQRIVYWASLTQTVASWMPSPFAGKDDEKTTNDVAGNQYNLEQKPPDKGTKT